MRSKNIFYLIVLIACALLVWGTIMWPLPRHYLSAVPVSAGAADNQAPFVELVPGDHLQLYYHFWLLRDMLRGRTPFFKNHYEFCFEEEEEEQQQVRFEPYYIPFSLVYALTSPLLGDMGGWNAASLFAVLLNFAGLYFLAGRYCSDRFYRLCVSLVALSFPYQWRNLLAGSPTGYGMAFLPWLVAGLDLAIRERRISGGWMAGLAILGAYCSDMHCFYFAMLFAPGWSMLLWLGSRSWSNARELLFSLAPVVMAGGLALILGTMASRHLGKTEMAAGRSWQEASFSSPQICDVFPGTAASIGGGAYLSIFLLCILFAGIIVRTAGEFIKRDSAIAEPQARLTAGTTLILYAVIPGILLVILLALGTNGPWEGLPFRLARKLLPRFKMLRQSPKIFCLMPALLAAAVSLLFLPLCDGRTLWRRSGQILLCLLSIGTIVESAAGIKKGFTVLPSSLAAYEVAAEHAKAENIRQPVGLALPLWPGDSHFSSVYEYGITRSRIRLLNGYSPAVPATYRTRVFEPLEVLNQGILEESQLLKLKSLNVSYLFFHENLFPEKVSAFPPAITLRRLYGSSRLKPVWSEGPIHVFFLDNSDQSGGNADSLWGPPRFLPSRHWIPHRQPEVEGADFAYPLTLRAPMAAAPYLRYLMLLSNGGTLASEGGFTVPVPESSTWLEIPFSKPLGDIWRVTAGLPNMRHALLVAGEESLQELQRLTRWNAADWFHNGATDISDGSLLFDPAFTPAGRSLYGPNLPYPPGSYIIRFVSSPELATNFNRTAGFITISDPENGRKRSVTAELKAGSVTALKMDTDGADPLLFEFYYNRRFALRLQVIELEAVVSSGLQ